MNPGPPALDASTVPQGYRGGGVCISDRSMLCYKVFPQFGILHQDVISSFLFQNTNQSAKLKRNQSAKLKRNQSAKLKRNQSAKLKRNQSAKLKYTGAQFNDYVLYFQGGSLRGSLTKLGQNQMFNKGKQLRREYVEDANFLTSIYNPEQVQ